jgi:hypothetical protein
MTDKKRAEAIAELLDIWNTCRARWIADFGDARGFSKWFTAQLFGVPAAADFPPEQAER